jgi:hypothetical protein
MATTRFSLIQWDDDTAAVDRTQFNDAFASIDNLGAGYTQTTGAPGAASAAKVGFIHFNTTDETLFYCDGSAWHQINIFANTTDSTISAITPGDSKSAGSSTDVAKADHVHEMPAFGSIANLAASATSTDGSATTFAKSDHVHGIPNSTITNAMLAGSITGSKLSNGTVTTTQIASNTITGSNINSATTITAANIGVGVSPSYPLDVDGEVRASGVVRAEGDIRVGVSGGGDSVIYFHDDNSNTWRVFGWDDDENRFNLNDNTNVTGNITATGTITGTFSGNLTGNVTGTASNAALLDTLDSTQFLRSDAVDTTTGRLTIDTSSVSTAGLQSLNIVDDSTNGTAGISIQYPNNTGFVQHGVFRMSNASVHRWVFLQENNSSLADAQLNNLYYAGSLTSTSDETLKNNEGPALGLSFVNRLAPFTGTWIDGDGEKHQFLGAQSVEAALTAEGVNAADYGMIGNDSEIGPRTMSYMELVPVLVKAVQELTDRLEAVEAGS